MVATNERVGKAGAGGRLEGEWKWKARERRSAREGRGEETCRRISLGSGAGLFNERAHSTPPSSVAPAGWRPPGSGSAVGGSCLFHHRRTQGGGWGWRFIFSPYLWSNQRICTDTCTDSEKQPEKHSLRISLKCTHAASGRRGLPHARSLFFFFAPVRGIIDSAWHINIVVITPASPLKSSGSAHSCASCWEKSPGSGRLLARSVPAVARSTVWPHRRHGRLTRQHLPIDVEEEPFLV